MLVREGLGGQDKQSFAQSQAPEALSSLPGGPGQGLHSLITVPVLLNSLPPTAPTSVTHPTHTHFKGSPKGVCSPLIATVRFTF